MSDIVKAFMLENRLPEYAVARLAINGAAVMEAVPRMTSFALTAVTVKLVVHSSSLLIVKNEALRLPVVPM